MGSEDGDGNENEADAADGDGSDRVAFSHPITIPTGVVQKCRKIDDTCTALELANGQRYIFDTVKTLSVDRYECRACSVVASERSR